MFVTISKSKESTKFQTITQSKFSLEIESSTDCILTFTPNTNKTITPNESEFISISKRRVYKYHEKE